jgi:hypothetical protein
VPSGAPSGALEEAGDAAPDRMIGEMTVTACRSAGAFERIMAVG